MRLGEKAQVLQEMEMAQNSACRVVRPIFKRTSAAIMWGTHKRVTFPATTSFSAIQCKRGETTGLPPSRLMRCVNA